MAQYFAPGVYVEEFDSLGQPIQGVGTSTAGFVGIAERGPSAGTPVLVTNMNEFRNTFGSYISETMIPDNFKEYRYLAYAVERFFANGGSLCYVMRAVPDGAMAAKVAYEYSGAENFTIDASSVGTWGNKLCVKITPSHRARVILKQPAGSDSTKWIVNNASALQVHDVMSYEVQSDSPTVHYTRVVSIVDNTVTFDTNENLTENLLLSTCEFDVSVFFGGNQTPVEIFTGCNLIKNGPTDVRRVLAQSKLIQCNTTLDQTSAVHPFQTLTGYDPTVNNQLTVELANGNDGTFDLVKLRAAMIGSDESPDQRTGIKAFLNITDVSIMAVPGVTDEAVQNELITHCTNAKNRFAVLDIPFSKKSPTDVLAYRNQFDSMYAAMYHPWLKMIDQATGSEAFFPPSGSVIGVYARTDRQRGVFKAPANEVVYNALGLSVKYGAAEQELLNPKGVNLIRSFPGQGIRIWGARTISSNSLWRHVNVRRLFIYLEQSVLNATNWVVFEPNTPQLWGRIQRTLEAFLTTVWRSGALVGNSPTAAFYVKIGTDTMTTDDIDNGRLICEVGVAPVKPAEFVVFRFTQQTAQLD